MTYEFRVQSFEIEESKKEEKTNACSSGVENYLVKDGLNLKNTLIVIILAFSIFLIIIGALFKFLNLGFGEGALMNGNTILVME